jgi:hypothetical protein
VASLNVNSGGGVSVKVHDIGTCVITCEGENGVTAECTVTVSEIFIPADNQSNTEADFPPNGLFKYGDAVYTHAAFVENGAKTYAQTGLYYKKLFGEDVRVSMVVAPVSAMVIDNPSVTSKIKDQGVIIKQMQALADPSVNFVNVYPKMYAHRSEYLFFKSDHHWTGRGAYYAYAAFAESVGFEPTPLDEFEYEILTETYSGSMYQYTGDPEVATFKDSVEVFYPTKKHTMTITDAYGRNIVETAAWSLSRHPADLIMYHASNKNRDDIAQLSLSKIGLNFNVVLSYDLRTSPALPEISENPGIADIVKFALEASKLDWAVAAPDERMLYKYNTSSYYIDGYHHTGCMQGSTTYTLPYWMGVYHGMLCEQ